MVRCVSRRFNAKLVVVHVTLISEEASISELRELQKLITTRECAKLLLCHIQRVMVRIGGARYTTENLLEYLTSSNNSISEISNVSKTKDDKPFLVVSFSNDVNSKKEKEENSIFRIDQEGSKEEERILCGMCVLAIKYNVTQCGLAALNLLRAACALTSHIYFDMDELLDDRNSLTNNKKVKRRAAKLSEASCEILRSMHGIHFSCVVRV